MTPYQTRSGKLPGRRYADLRHEALKAFKELQRRTRRKPYIRSAYFHKQKIFFDFFWPHLFQKHPDERKRRLRYVAAAIEVLRSSRHHPKTLQNPNKPYEIFHRFAGKTREGDMFYVQVKENKRKDQKYFISCFPER